MTRPTKEPLRYHCTTYLCPCNHSEVAVPADAASCLIQYVVKLTAERDVAIQECEIHGFTKEGLRQQVAKLTAERNTFAEECSTWKTAGELALRTVETNDKLLGILRGQLAKLNAERDEARALVRRLAGFPSSNRQRRRMRSAVARWDAEETP